MHTVPLHAVMKSWISQTAHPQNTRWNVMSHSCERCLEICAGKQGFFFVLSSNPGKLVERWPTTRICLFQKELLHSSACRHCLMSVAEESSTYGLSPALVHTGFATIIVLKNVPRPSPPCNEISAGL